MKARFFQPRIDLYVFAAIFAAIAISQPGYAGQSSRLSALIDLPPAMEKMTGDPPVGFSGAGGGGLKVKINNSARISPPSLRRIHRGARRTSASTSERIRSIEVSGAQSGAGNATRQALARAVLNHFWDTYFAKRDNTLETIALSRDRFLKIGMARLLGRRPAGDSQGDAWWQVRMGLPLQADPDHHLMAIVAKSADGFSLYGHFAFGLRKAGGDPEGDLAFDPRAPWIHHEGPGIGDWFNDEEELVSGVHKWNLYDWLYTQTHRRDLKVETHFVKATREQVQLLKGMAKRKDMEEIAPFGTLRYNCATMGERVFEGLLPVGKQVSFPHPVADIPDRLARKIDKRFGSVKRVEVPTQMKNGKEERTAASTIFRAPNRARTPEFLKLLRVPEVN